MVLNTFPAGTSLHRVSRGETLYSISRKYDLSIHDLARLNGLSISDKVVVGQEIMVRERSASAGQPQTEPARAPSSNGRIITHTVNRGETLFSISQKYNVSTVLLREIL